MGQFVGLACGLVLAIAGVRLGYLSVRGAAGRWMGRWIAAVRGQPLRLVVAGATSAAVLHSSSAVEVMVLALSQAGALALDEALFVIVGANVGTTATAQLVALRLPAAGLILMAGGLSRSSSLEGVRRRWPCSAWVPSSPACNSSGPRRGRWSLSAWHRSAGRAATRWAGRFGWGGR